MNPILRKVENGLYQPKSSREASILISDILAGVELDNRTRKALEKRVAGFELDLKWNPATGKTKKLFASPREFHPLEIAMGFSEEGYLSFGTAVYWTQLTDQVPSHYYISIERKNKAVGRHSADIDDFYLQEQFMKPPRETARQAAYKGNLYSLLERNATGLLGVTDRSIVFNHKRIRFRISGLERTLLDCAVFPHRAGGIRNVIEIFAKAKRRLSIETLMSYYRQLDFTYPYWQRIGLILEKTAGKIAAQAWREEFGEPGFTFYMDRSFKSNWRIDPRWKVAFPPGLFP